MGRGEKASWIHFSGPTTQENPETWVISRLRRPKIRRKSYCLERKGFGVSLGISLGFLILKSSVTWIISEPLPHHLHNVPNSIYIIVWKFMRENSTKSQRDGSQEQGIRKPWLLLGSISLPEQRTHVESMFLRDDSQDNFQTLRKVKNLLLCHISLWKHAVGLVRTIQ